MRKQQRSRHRSVDRPVVPYVFGGLGLPSSVAPSLAQSTSSFDRSTSSQQFSPVSYEADMFCKRDVFLTSAVISGGILRYSVPRQGGGVVLIYTSHYGEQHDRLVGGSRLHSSQVMSAIPQFASIIPPSTSHLATAAVPHVLIKHPAVPCTLLYSLCFCATLRILPSLLNDGAPLN